MENVLRGLKSGGCNAKKVRGVNIQNTPGFDTPALSIKLKLRSLLSTLALCSIIAFSNLITQNCFGDGVLLRTPSPSF